MDWFLAVLGLHCRAGFPLVVESGGYPGAVMCRLPFAAASSLRSTDSRVPGLRWLWHLDWVLVAPGL